MISFGSVDADSRLLQNIFSDEYVWLEPEFGFPPDIALFHTATKIIFNPNIQPIRLPSIEWGSFTFEGWSTTIIGWGRAQAGRLGLLQYSEFLVQENSLCRFEEDLVCAKALFHDADLGGALSGIASDVFSRFLINMFLE